MGMIYTSPFHMDFSHYSAAKLVQTADDETTLSHFDRDDLLQLVGAMADMLRVEEEVE